MSDWCIFIKSLDLAASSNEPSIILLSEYIRHSLDPVFVQFGYHRNMMDPIAEDSLILRQGNRNNHYISHYF